MRIIRLGKVDLERKAGFRPYCFGDKILFYIGPNGEFEFNKGKIAPGGISPGERLVFSYATRIVYVAVAENKVVKKEDGSKFFCINKESIRKGNGKPFQNLQQELKNIGIQISLTGNTWNIINIDDEKARQILQKFVDEEIPQIKTRDGFEGRKACDIAPPARVDVSESRILRDTKLSHVIKELNDYICQLCGTSLDMPDNKKYAEAHHIQPLGQPHNGRDIEANMICVCPNCHALLDYGAIELPKKIEGGHEIGQVYINYHNDKIYKKI